MSIDELVGMHQGPYYYGRGLFIFMRQLSPYFASKLKAEMQMAFGGVDVDDCRRDKFHFEGIAVVVVIILLLIAMGIVF
ncbi:hypothetical protein [Desulfosporosinus metallidurans]|nr:hypothetical protein [Desulfosporosinus metallidurans]